MNHQVNKETMELLDCVPVRRTMQRVIASVFPYKSPKRSLLRELGERVTCNAELRQHNRNQLMQSIRQAVRAQ